VLCSAKCPSWQSQLVQTVTGYGYTDQSVGLTSAQIKSKLASGPVCLAMDIYADFNLGPGFSPSFDSNGVYRYDGISASVGPHAVLCVGYQDSLGCWICKNSWGNTWGNMQGFFKIAYGQCNIEYEMSWVTFTQSTSNSAPNTPSSPNPSNHATGISTTADLSWTGGDPDIGDTVTYDVYFGTTSPPTSVTTGQSGTTYDPGTISASTKYYWQIVSWDNHGASTSGPIWDFTTAGGGNSAPNTPSKPSGSTSGKAGEEYNYSTSAIDPDGDQVYYKWDWGDEISNWDGPYDSGLNVEASHIWNTKGDYSIKVKSKDTYGDESDWSDPLSISMPRNNLFISKLLQYYIDNYSFMFKFLLKIMG
jgi:hypothetical protein